MTKEIIINEDAISFSWGNDILNKKGIVINREKLELEKDNCLISAIPIKINGTSINEYVIQPVPSNEPQNFSITKKRNENKLELGSYRNNQWLNLYIDENNQLTIIDESKEWTITKNTNETIKKHRIEKIATIETKPTSEQIPGLV